MAIVNRDRANTQSARNQGRVLIPHHASATNQQPTRLSPGAESTVRKGLEQRGGEFFRVYRGVYNNIADARGAPYALFPSVARVLSRDFLAGRRPSCALPKDASVEFLVLKDSTSHDIDFCNGFYVVPFVSWALRAFSGVLAKVGGVN